jgi:hypothetical protein
MTWVKGVVGVVCLLIGLVWIGQGVGLLPGSVMSGQMMWAIIGLVLVLVGGWLLWSVVRARSATGVTRSDGRHPHLSGSGFGRGRRRSGRGWGSSAALEHHVRTQGDERDQPPREGRHRDQDVGAGPQHAE